MGTVNIGTSGAACWCGNQISYVTVMAGLLGANSVNGEAGERTWIGSLLLERLLTSRPENCYPCNGLALTGASIGVCGNMSVDTIAIYARTF